MATSRQSSEVPDHLALTADDNMATSRQCSEVPDHLALTADDNMATSKQSSEVPDHLVCSVCLEMFKNPKLLPCHHTFCESCIHELLTPTQDFIQCPQCRKRIRLTKDRVSSLQANFYLAPLLEEARDPDHCDMHRVEKLRFLCLNCDKAVCCECVLQDHKQHDLKDFREAKENIRTEVDDGLAHYDTVLKGLVSKLEGIQSHRKVMENEMLSVECVLKERARMLHGAIDGQLEKSVQSLKKMVKPIDRSEQKLKEKVRLVQDLQEQMMILARKTGYNDLVTSSKEMQKTKEVTLDKILFDAGTESHMFNIPAVQCDDSLLCEGAISRFLGQVYTESVLTTTTSSLAIHEAFRVYPDKSVVYAVVHALCVDRDENVWVACKNLSAQGKGWVIKFSTTGRVLSKKVATEGRVCLASLPPGYVCVRVEGQYCEVKDIPPGVCEPPKHDVEKQYDVYNKMRARFLIRQHTNQECELRSVTMSGQDSSFVTKLFTQLPIAMDASEDGKLFAVLERGQNHVALFHRDAGSRPFSVFRGKSGDPFEPRDVCFYRIGGEERLMVADGMSKTLMLVKVDRDSGCDLLDEMKVCIPDSSLELLKPTALCPDLKGQLWVGCQGGCVAYLSPRSSYKPRLEGKDFHENEQQTTSSTSSV